MNSRRFILRVSDRVSVGGVVRLIQDAIRLCGTRSTSWLEEQGAQVLGPVPSVADALELLETGPPPDAAVLDINLGDEQVFAVADALEAVHVPFVFLSGYDAKLIPADYESVRRCGKPLDRSRLLHALGERLQG